MTIIDPDIEKLLLCQLFILCLCYIIARRDCENISICIVLIAKIPK